MKVAIARPVPAANNTAFQTQAEAYEYIMEQHPDIEIHIIADEANRFEYDGIRVREVAQSKVEWAKFWTQKIAWKLRDWDSIVYQDFEELHSAIIEEEYDVIETSDPTLYPYAQTACHAAKEIGASLTCGSSVTKDLISPVRREDAQEVFDYASTIICPTPIAYDRFSRLGYLNGNDDRLFVSGFPIDHSKFQPGTSESSTVTVVSVGRLAETKGVKQMARALRPLLMEQSDLNWEIIGDGDLKEWLQSYVASHDLEESVTVHGEVPHDEIPAILARSDIFLLHSISTGSWEEYFGVSYAEAMSAGLPVVGSESGAIPWVVRDGVDGVLLEEKDVEGIRDTINRFYNESELRSEYGSNGRERVLEKFSIEAYAENLYENWASIT
jgi:glycosyltransferase involved in cell wall biosynthesis